MENRICDRLDKIDGRLQAIKNYLNLYRDTDVVTEFWEDTLKGDTHSDSDGELSDIASLQPAEEVLRMRMELLEKKYGDTDHIPVQDICTAFKKDLKRLDSSLLAKCKDVSEEDMSDCIGHLLEENFQVRPKSYKQYDMLLSILVSEAKQKLKAPEPEDQRFDWHPLDDGEQSLQHAISRSSGDSRYSRADWFLPKLVLCYDDEGMVKKWTEWVSEAIRGDLDEGRYEVSCYRFMGTIDQVRAAWPREKVEVTTQPCLLLFGDNTVKRTEPFPLEESAERPHNAIYRWIVRSLAIEYARSARRAGNGGAIMLRYSPWADVIRWNRTQRSCISNSS